VNSRAGLCQFVKSAACEDSVFLSFDSSEGGGSELLRYVDNYVSVRKASCSRELEHLLID
jgi:hypothetical protein